MTKSKPSSDAAEEVVLNSSDRLHEQLAVAVDAAIGIIAIRAPLTEVFRVQDAIYTFACQQEKQFRSHMSHLGWCSYQTADIEDIRQGKVVFDPLETVDTQKTTAQVVAAIHALATKDNPAMYPDDGYYVMLDSHYAFEEPAFQSAIRNQSHRSLTCDQRLFIIVPEHIPVPDGISSLLHVIDFDPPDRTELNDSFADLVEQVDEGSRTEFTDEELDEILSNAQGMTKTAFDTAVSLAITTHSYHHGTPEGLEASEILSTVRDYKTSILRKTNVLELCSKVELEDVGGLEYYKEWLLNRAKSFTPEAQEFGITPSRGCLVVGPPGTGKSLVAKASGAALGLSVIRFDIGRVFGSYIGQSEQQMRTVLKMIDEMSPCVLFVDEVDKGFAGMMNGAGGDSGTSMRVFGTFLTWMQERDQFKRPVFLILTANRVTGLPPELLRRGRVDELWAVGMPNVVEREAILRIHTDKRGHTLSPSDMAEAVDLTDNLVGAEIESLVEGALNLDFTVGNKKLTLESLKKEHSTLKPMHLSFGRQLQEMEEWAKTNARPASVEATAAQAASVSAKRGIARPRLHRKLRTSRTTDA